MAQQGQDGLGAMMAAQGELSNINAARAQNSQAEQAFLQQQQAASAVMMQAAQLGTSGGLGQQVGAMNPQTQALLAQYGVTGSPSPGKTTNSSKTTQSGNNIKVENTTTTNNEIKIVNPPSQSGGDNGNQAKFQTWLSNSFAKQNQDYEVQRRTFARRDRDLEKQSNKMMRELEKSTKTFGEKLNPKTWAIEQASQIKTVMTVLLLTVGPTLVKPIAEGISGLGDRLKRMFGVEGEGTVLGKLKEELFDLGDYIKTYFSDMMEDRKAAFQKAREKHSRSVAESSMGTIVGGLASTLFGPIAPILGALVDVFRGVNHTVGALPDYVGALVSGTKHFETAAEKEIDLSAVKRQSETAHGGFGAKADNRDFAQGEHLDRYGSEWAGGTTKGNRNEWTGKLERGDEYTQHEQTRYSTSLMTSSTGQLDLAGVRQAHEYIGKEKGDIKMGSYLQTLDWLCAHGYDETSAQKFISDERFITIKTKLRLWYKIQSASVDYLSKSSSVMIQLYAREYEVGQSPNIEAGDNQAIINATPEDVKRDTGRNITSNPESLRVYYLTQAGKKEVEKNISKKYNNGKEFSFKNSNEDVIQNMFVDNQVRLNENNPEFDTSSLGVIDEDKYNELDNLRQERAAYYSESTAAKEDLDVIRGITNSISNTFSQITGTTDGIKNTKQLSNSILNGDYRVSGEFGEQRPGYVHKGIDFAVPEGTQVSTPVDGTVVEVGNSGKKGYGKYIKLRTDDGKLLIFGHLSKQYSKKNDKEYAGKIIGLSGNTGSSTGPHLHFEVRDENNTKINPIDYFKTRPESVASESVDVTETVGAGDSTKMVDHNGIPTMSFGDGAVIAEFNKTALDKGLTGWEAVSRIKVRTSDGSYRYVKKENMSDKVLGAGVSVESLVNHQFNSNQYKGLGTETDYATDKSGSKREIDLGLFKFSGTKLGELNVINTLKAKGINNWDGLVPFSVVFTSDYSTVHSIYTLNLKSHIAKKPKEKDAIPQPIMTGNLIYSITGFKPIEEDLYTGLPKDTLKELNKTTSGLINPLHIISGYFIPQEVWEKISELIQGYRQIKLAIDNGYFSYDEKTGSWKDLGNSGVTLQDWQDSKGADGIQAGISTLPSRLGIDKDTMVALSQTSSTKNGGISVFTAENPAEKFTWVGVNNRLNDMVSTFKSGISFSPLGGSNSESDSNSVVDSRTQVTNDLGTGGMVRLGDQVDNSSVVINNYYSGLRSEDPVGK